MCRRFALWTIVIVIFATAHGRAVRGLDIQKRSQIIASHVSGAAEAGRNAHNDETRRSAGKLAGDWRYVPYHGRHWYWMPNQTWSVWQGRAWMPYSPGMFSPEANNASRQVTGYRGVPATGEEFRQPMNYQAPAGRQFSSPGPSMPNEHFMHP
ncbi:MAG TPA: hypothetical protein VGG64_08455 [Pirellulales bacterium]|jgi:hypothetical protein